MGFASHEIVVGRKLQSALIHMMTCQKRHWSCYAFLENDCVLPATCLLNL